MTTSPMGLKPNMLAQVIGMVPSMRVAYLRSSGRYGHEGFLMAIDSGLVAMYLRLPPDNDLGYLLADNLELYPAPTFPVNVPSFRPRPVIDVELVVNMQVLVQRTPSQVVERLDTNGNRMLFLRSDFLCNEDRIVSLAIIEGGSIAITGSMFQMCTNLRRLDVSGLRSLSAIGVHSFSHCKSLTEVKLPTLLPRAERPAITQTSLPTHDVGANMLQGATLMRGIDLCPLRHAVRIDSLFCEGCSSLVFVDLSPLQSLESIEEGFLSGCTSLGTVRCDVPLLCLRTVGDSFLRGCSRIRELRDLPYILHAVVSVGYSFMAECHGLQRLSFTSEALPQGCPSLLRFEGNVFKKCGALESVDLRGLEALQCLGYSAFNNCTSLEEIDCSPLRSLTRVAHTFAALCRSLKSISFRDLRHVTSLEGGACCCVPGKTPLLVLVDCRGLFVLSNVDRSFAAGVSEVLWHYDCDDDRQE